MLRIHYHSDCPFFGGCENMLANFFNSEEIRKAYTISFSYRQSVQYTTGFEQRVKCDFPIYPVSFPDLNDYTQLPKALPLLCKRVIMLLLRQLLTYPLFIYEILSRSPASTVFWE